VQLDGSASNDTSDMLGEMRQALLLQRVRYGSDAVTAMDVYRMATINGAKLLGFEKVGELREGWAADVAVFNIDQLGYAGALSDPLAALLFSGYDHQTAYTIVNGEIVVDGGRLVGIDEQELTRRANKISEKLRG
jgi:cytosine/adenosine deaminase-related metal-dependent hydrolase